MKTLRSSNPELGSYSAGCRDASEMIQISPEVSRLIIEVYGKTRAFVALGQVALGDEDTLIHVGLKTRILSGSIQRVDRELFAGDRLLDYRPSRVNALPLFTIPILGEGDDDFGVILTEDFTKHGELALNEDSRHFRIGVGRKDVPEGLHRDVYDGLDGDVHPEAFGHIVGYVGNREVLVDFDDITYTRESSLAPYEEFAKSIALKMTDLHAE